MVHSREASPRSERDYSSLDRTAFMARRLSNGPLHTPQVPAAQVPGSTAQMFYDKDQRTKLHKVSVNDVVKSLNRRAHPPFGIEGYYITKTDVYTSRPLTTKFTKFKLPSYIDDAVKAKKWMPPADYNVTLDWAKSAKNSPRGAFLKNPRKTFTVEVADEHKKRAFPGPAEYQTINLESKNGEASKSNRSEKACEFIEEARYRGTVTPAATAYKPNFVSSSDFAEQHLA